MKTGTAIELILALGIATQSWSSAHAQTASTAPIVVSVPGTGLDITTSGTPIVNIATPDANGTSYNVFSKLNVGPEGTIFNNSQVIGQSVIAGQVLANNNLRANAATRPAALIISEVRGGTRSDLLGTIEIFGTKAGLVIANPAGITCDGCGFINISRASLSTGVPTFDANRAFTGFQVNGGAVQIQGRGLSGSNVDFFDIVTGSAQINASLYARDLLVAGGNGSFNYANRTATAGAVGGGLLAIDSSILGGMYANRIRLIGTGAGVGINLAGVVSALDGSVSIAADGAINVRTIDAGGDAVLVSRSGSVRVEELVSSGGAAIINAATDIIIADNQAAVTAATTSYSYCFYGYCGSYSYSTLPLVGASIDALGSVVLSAGRDILNVNRGSISGDAVSLIANQDILIGGGAGIYANNLSVNALRDVSLKANTTLRNSGQYTDLGRGLYQNTYLTSTEVIGAQLDAFGALFVTAGRDVSLEAAALTADGVVGLSAARDISIGGIASTGTTTLSWKSSKNTFGNSIETVSNYDGSNISAGSGLFINANEELDITGSALRSESGVNIRAAQGTAYIAGSDIAATGNVALTARDIVVTGSINSSNFDETVRTVKRGFLSKRTTTSVTSNQIETVFASSISGNRILLDSIGQTSILDSDIAGDQAVDITAGGNITISSVPTTSDYLTSTKVKKSGFSLSSAGLFLGVSKTSNVVDTTQVSNIGSLIGAASGAVRISAGAGISGIPSSGDLDIVGSRIAALNAVTLAGDTVDIVNNVNVTSTSTTYNASTFGLTLGVSSPLLNSITAVARLGDIATKSSNARVQAVSLLAAGLAVRNGYDSAKTIVDTVKSGNGSLDASVTASIGYSRTTSSSLSVDQTIVASQVAGGDIAIFARGGTGRAGVNIYGSDVAATRNLAIFSNAGIDLGAAIETDRYSGQSQTTGVTLEASVRLGLGKDFKKNLAAPTFTLGFNSSSSRYNGVDVTARASVLGAGDTVTINTLGLLNIDGSQVSANRVLIDAGALNILSRQNTSTYLSRERSTALSLSYQVGVGFSGVANFGGGNLYGNFATVADQAGIRSGVGGFDIRIGGLTELKGGIIGSTATADLNRLTTGTLRTSAINNFETYSATSFNFGFGFGNIGFNSNTGSTTSNGTGISIPGFGTFTFTFPSYFYASGGQASVSNSAVSPATVIIGSGEAASYAALGALSRDTSTSSVLTRQFTEARRAEIAQGFDAARQLVSEVTVFFANRANEQGKAETSAIAAGVQYGADGRPSRDSLGNLIAQNPAAQPFIDIAAASRSNYGAGSTARILATALTGAAGANVTGSLASFAQAAAVNVLQSYATTRVKSIADSFFTPSGNPTVESEAVRTALQSIVGCAGAAPTGNCASGALGAASSVILNNLVTALSTPEPRDAAGNIIPRSLADQQARTALIATLTGAIAAALDLNAGAASTAAQIETENNYLARQQLAARDREYANCNNSTACQLEVFARYTGISVGQDALVIGAIPFGAGEQIFADLSGLYEAVRHPVETYQAIRALATDPLVRAQLGASVLADIDLKLAVLNRALEVGGPANSIAAGKVFGSVAITVAGAVTGAYGAVGATGKLLSIGVKLTRAAVDTVDATLAARAAANAAKAASNFRPLATFSEGLQSAGNYIRAPEISIPYGFPISAQGAALEAAVAQTGVYGDFLGNSAKTFDFFVPTKGLATSTKTINTLTDAKLASARQVEDAAKKAINAALNYVSRGPVFSADVPTNLIVTKQVVIAVPVGTTRAQLVALARAVDYGRLNKIVVKIVITGR